MGVVYAGYDDRLDRRVALKVLHKGLNDDGKDGDRLWREAQAMARISHPNVVTVHEVGRADDSVYVVMEFIRGQTLTQWLQSGPSWEEVLAAFVSAGKGLKAAHELGMVHRDFKPANVMRGEAGEVKVLDFGLARAIGSLPTGGVAPSGVTASGDSQGWSSSVTVAGTVMGTLPYMSPEQQDAQEFDERSDQYSYCVALWAGLTGRLPFGAGKAQAVLEAKLNGPPPWPKGAPPVPGRLVEAIRRGMAVEPDDRWPSMQALLTELQWDPRKRRRQWSFGVAGTAVVGLGGFAAQGWAEQRAQRCSGAESELGGVWDAGRREQAKAAFLAVDRPFASDAWSRAEDTLAGYADQWVQMHTAACEAATVRGEESGQMYDARMRCLGRARVGLEAAVNTLTDADGTVVDKAHDVVAELRPLEKCDDIDALESEFEPPRPQEEVAVTNARKALARAASERAAGRTQRALQAVEEASQGVEGIEYGPAKAEWALEQGRVQEAQRDYDAAEASFIEGVELAVEHGLDASLLDAVSNLLFVVGVRQKKTEEGLRYWPMVRGLSDAESVQRAVAQRTVGQILYAQRKYDEAEKAHRTALTVIETELGSKHLQAAEAQRDLGRALHAQGKFSAALDAFRASLQAKEAALGSKHPEVGLAWNSLGDVFVTQGRYAEAEAEYRSALRRSKNVTGPNQANVAVSLNRLGRLYLAREDYAEANRHFQEALQLRVAALGSQHPDVADSHSSLGAVLQAQGRNEAAEEEFREALSIKEAALGGEHPDLSEIHLALGSLKQEQGLLEEALPFLKKAWNFSEYAGLTPDRRAEAAFRLAQVLWNIEGNRRDRVRAGELAKKAAEVLSPHEIHAQQLTQIQSWVAEHEQPSTKERSVEAPEAMADDRGATPAGQAEE